MFKKILHYGILGGLIVGAIMFGLAVAMKGHPPLAWAMIIGYASMLLALSMVFVAIKKRRDEDLGGVISFVPALLLGLGVSFVASIVYALAWEATLAFTGMDFAGDYVNALIAEQKAHGLDGAALDQYIAGMEQFKADYANTPYRLGMSFSEIFPVGVIVSLVAAALLRNPRFLPLRRVARAR